MPWKITYIFNAGRLGWSESWYWTPPTIDLGADAAIDAATRVQAKRKLLLGKGTFLEAIRVSDVAVRGDSKIQAFDPTALVNPLPDSDTPWNAILCRCEAGSLYRRQVWLRGLPDEWIHRDPVTGLNFSDGTLEGNILALQVALIADGFQLRVLNKEPGTFIDTPVTGLTADVDGYTVVGCAGLGGLTNQDTVRLHNFQGPDKKILNRVWAVKAANAGGVTVNLLFATLITPALDVQGKIENRVVAYRVVTRLQSTRLAGRQTGRAFFVPRGRRRVVR